MFTKTTGAGNTIEMTYVSDYLSSGTPQFRVVIDGTEVATGAMIDTLRESMVVKGSTVVAVLPIKANGKKSGVGLTAEDVVALEAEAEANRSDEARERIRLSQLRSQRDALARNLSGAYADAYPDDLYDSEYEHVNIRRRNAAMVAEAEINPARAALAAFDAAHPEIIAAIKQEEAESVERNMWN